MVSAFADRIRFYETLDPSTQAGQRYQQAIALTPNCAYMQKPTPRPEAIERLKSGLGRPGSAEVYAEYQRMSRKRAPHWYQLFGGPHDLRGLAHEVGREGTYEILYGGLSILAHAKDALLGNLCEAREGGPAVRPIRNPEMIPQTVSHAVDFALEAIRLMIQRYRPEEQTRFAEWYVKEFRNLRFAVDGEAAPPWPPKIST
jgi:hypothetical protein